MNVGVGMKNLNRALNTIEARFEGQGRLGDEIFPPSPPLLSSTEQGRYVNNKDRIAMAGTELHGLNLNAKDKEKDQDWPKTNLGKRRLGFKVRRGISKI
uniref:Uncharacterized protein n=1 Tax=Cannabis sativa TaxID=3483 RepID=A0A803NPA0_CANSA